MTIIFNYDDQIALLSWVDFYVYKTSSDPSFSINFEDNILKYLEKERGKVYTRDQLDTKLRRFWRSSYQRHTSKPTPFDKQKILQSGSKCFHFDAKMQGSIDAASSKLKTGEDLYPSDPSIENQASSEDELSSSEVQQPRRHPLQDHGNTDVHNRTEITRKYKKSITGFQQRDEITSDSPIHGDSNGIDSELEGKSTTRILRKCRKLCSYTISDSDDESDITSSSLSSIVSISNHISQNIEACSLDMASRSQDNQQNVSSVYHHKISEPLEDHDALFTQTDFEKLYNEISDKDRQILKLEDEIKQLLTARNSSAIHEAEIIELHCKDLNTKLRQVMTQLRQKTEVARFSSLRRIERRTIDVDTLCKMQAIGHDIEQILFNHDANEKILAPEGESRSELCALLYPGLDLPHLLSFSPDYVVSALTWSAIRKWVFESENFPAFGQDSTMLDIYRKLILINDGRTALRNIEIAARDAWVKEPRFQEYIIRSEATRLASNFAKVLSPLFSRNSTDSVEYISLDTGQDRQAWEDRRSRLISIFGDALKIKAATSVTTEQYAVYIPPPSTEYDPSNMINENDQVGAYHEGHNVDLCIRGAFVTYAAPSNNPQEDCVPSRLGSFGRRFNRTSDVEADMRVLTKALVITNSRPSIGGLQLEIATSLQQSRRRSSWIQASKAGEAETGPAEQPFQNDISARGKKHNPTRQVLVYEHWIRSHNGSLAPSPADIESLANQLGSQSSSVSKWFKKARKRKETDGINSNAVLMPEFAPASHQSSIQSYEPIEETITSSKDQGQHTLEAWREDHGIDAFPTEEDMDVLATRSGLTSRQISMFFNKTDKKRREHDNQKDDSERDLKKKKNYG